MPKKIIFIDWDGTLSSSKFWEERIKTDNNFAQIVKDFFALDKELISDWMNGRKTSEEINKIINQRSGLDENELWQIFITSCQRMEIEPEALNLIQTIRTKHTVILATDNMDCFTRFTVPALKLNEKFDLIINSADIGYQKKDTNGKLFIDCTKKFNILNMSDAYLIDDSAKTCELFKQLGGNSLKVNNIGDTITYLKMLSES
ncbi:MAG: hypothetical protein V1646_03755 [bacterium]